MYFQYDTTGTPLGFIYNGTQYLYLTNQMGDVISITDAQGKELVQYEYDEWGKNISVATTNSTEEEIAIANANPLRYRGYYYDTETGYYYLQSRYYDPSICRFINADIPEIANISKDIPVGTNSFAYCCNNPINNSDPSGKALINIICAAIGAVIGLPFGKWLANKLLNPKTTKNYKAKYYTLRAAAVIGGAALGWFAGSLISKLIATYLKSNPTVIFKLVNKFGASKYHTIMKFLGINPFTFVKDTSKFIAIARLFNSKSVTLNLSWTKALFSQAKKLGFKISIDKPHGGWSYHIHISGANGKFNKLHIQIAKAAYEYLKKIL